MFYPSQREKIAGALAGLKAKSRVWMICDCGTGKTAMSIATAWALLHRRPKSAVGPSAGPPPEAWQDPAHVDSSDLMLMLIELCQHPPDRGSVASNLRALGQASWRTWSAKSW